MSFSTQVKNELEGHIPAARHCRLAELGALVIMLDGGTDKTAAFEKKSRLMRMLKLDTDMDAAVQAVKLTRKDGCLMVDRLLIERACCKQAFLRGAFLASGSVTDPSKGYHLEIAATHMNQAELLADIMRSFELEPKIIQRKKYFVVYIKDGSMIVDILNIMGAHISLMDMENVRILKYMRNKVNRGVNCETANLNKTVSAAVRQLEDIEYIERTKGLSYLPEQLIEIATARREAPDAPLAELGQRLDTPLGKSGVNHRLRKISDIADELRRNYND